MVSNFDHVHLYSADPERALAFWCDALGAEFVGMLGDNTLLILGGLFVAISAYPADIQPASAPPVGDGAVKAGFGIAHVGLNVDDLDALIPRLEAAGAHIHSEPRGEAPLRFVYLTAPDGVVIELTQYVLTGKLAAAGAALTAFNKSVHWAKRAIGRRLLAAAAH